jgi:hypothetical protein
MFTSRTEHLKEAKTVEELKKLYRRLAMKNHPDLGGDVTRMQEINAEYEWRLKMMGMYGNTGNRQRNSTDYYEPPPSRDFEAECKDAFETVSLFAMTANPWFQVHRNPETGEVVAFGRTFPHKEYLKAMGFWWDNDRKLWHYVGKTRTIRL